MYSETHNDETLSQLRKRKSSNNLLFILKRKVSALTVASFFWKCFLHFVQNGWENKKIVKMQTSIKMLKYSFHDLIYHGFENWNFPFATIFQNSVSNVLLSFYQTLNVKVKWQNVRISWIFAVYSNRGIQSSIKWRERIVQKVSRSRCRGETSIFKTVMNLVINKIFQCFYIRVTFNNCLKGFLFHLLDDVRIVKREIGGSQNRNFAFYNETSRLLYDFLFYKVITVWSVDDFSFKLIAARSWLHKHSLYLPE